MRAIGKIGCTANYPCLVDPVRGASIAAESSKVGEHTALADKCMMGGSSFKFCAVLQKKCSAAQLRRLSRRAEGEDLRAVEAGGKNGRRAAAGGELQDIPIRSRI